MADDKADEYTLVDLPCGCQDVHYADGRIDREHDHVECDGAPLGGEAHAASQQDSESEER